MIDKFVILKTNVIKIDKLGFINSTDEINGISNLE